MIFVPVLVLVTVILFALAIFQSDQHTSSPLGRRLGCRRRRHDPDARPATPAFEAATANPDQIAADTVEDSMIRRFREGRTPVGDGITVSCGRCGTSQVVHPYRGLHRFALVCCSCHGRTTITLHAAG
ncbi:MAG TPA: hypothetical protein VGL20_07895 [Candidatus Dormibacteraeota bacterium]